MNHRETMKAYEDATNSHRFDEVEQLVSDKAVYWFTSHSYSGLETIRKYFEGTWEAIKEEVYSIRNIEWIAESDSMAVCLYTYHWKGFYQGELKEGQGKGTNVLVLEDGKWKIIHEHLSALN